MIVATHLATLWRSQRGLGLAWSSGFLLFCFCFVLFYEFLGSEASQLWTLTTANFPAAARVVHSVFRIQELNIPDGTCYAPHHPADGFTNTWNYRTREGLMFSWLFPYTLCKFSMLQNWSWLPNFHSELWDCDSVEERHCIKQGFFFLSIFHLSLWFRKAHFTHPQFGRKDYMSGSSASKEGTLTAHTITTTATPHPTGPCAWAVT